MTQARILIVEDERVVVRDIENRLRRLGYEVAGTTRFGEEAVRLAEELRPDLILMDIRLAGSLDGVEAATQIRARAQLPVVYLTAYSDEDTLARACVTEPFGYVYKPFDERELHTAIQMALYKHDAERRLRVSEEQFRVAQRMEAVGRLAGGVAHDFNNLLMVINGCSAMLAKEVSNQGRAQELLTEIQKAGTRAAALIRQLLAFGRKQPLRPQVIDLNELVLEQVQMLRWLLGEQIALEVRPEPGLGLVEVDPVQLEQVLMNLVVNARDAMPLGGNLTIEIRNVELTDSPARLRPGVRPGPFVRLSIADTGHGMDEATKAHIFEPFFTTKTLENGTGLGLSLVHGVVSQSGGHIEVSSEVGSGATFVIYLPVVDTPAPSHNRPTAR